jgi:hypothetical protein
LQGIQTIGRTWIFVSNTSEVQKLKGTGSAKLHSEKRVEGRFSDSLIWLKILFVLFCLIFAQYLPVGSSSEKYWEEYAEKPARTPWPWQKDGLPPSLTRYQKQ